MKERRVVVTGLGALTPIGNSVDEFWDNAVKGKSGAAQITRFNPEHFKTQFACQVKNFEPTKYLSRTEIKRTELFSQFGLHVASEAMEDSGLDLTKMSPFDIGVIWGCGNGGMATYEEEMKNFIANDSVPRFSPFFVPKHIINIAAGLISMKFGLNGINYTTTAACATSNVAIMDAYNYIKLGKAKVFVTGGSEAPITEACVGGFNSIKALSTNNENAAEACKPFDESRDGFVLGEGAGALILEDYEHAKKRGAHIYAEIVGASMTADAYHLTASHPDGLGAARAMELALEEAKINPDELDYINTHATSTPVGDTSEINAIKKVFGEAPKNLHISATKSMTGHLLGAAGALAGILSIKAINNNMIPPTINTSKIDPVISIAKNIVIQKALSKNIKTAMSNTFGFGGHNAIILFKEI